ncbi:hypothetical protein B4923_01290 [Brenneria roseae subsp. americana]|uniref:Uncharacterized protein n=1 Tax=Brenneria roseae subsp. americana TaxID=1508507 RepID=A0A2U1U2B5_9GAMM|nr:hypothetical protein B4923_01290 [Brenneria roseae subsp. americana]
MSDESRINDYCFITHLKFLPREGTTICLSYFKNIISMNIAGAQRQVIIGNDIFDVYHAPILPFHHYPSMTAWGDGFSRALLY